MKTLFDSFSEGWELPLFILCIFLLGGIVTSIIMHVFKVSWERKDTKKNS